MRFKKRLLYFWTKSVLNLVFLVIRSIISGNWPPPPHTTLSPLCLSISVCLSLSIFFIVSFSSVDDQVCREHLKIQGRIDRKSMNCMGYEVAPEIDQVESVEFFYFGGPFSMPHPLFFMCRPSSIYLYWFVLKSCSNIIPSIIHILISRFVEQAWRSLTLNSILSLSVKLCTHSPPTIKFNQLPSITAAPRPASQTSSFYQPEKTLVPLGAWGGGAVPGLDSSHLWYQIALQTNIFEREHTCSVIVLYA